MAYVCDMTKELSKEKPIIKLGDSFITVKNDFGSCRAFSKWIKENKGSSEIDQIDAAKKYLLSDIDAKKFDSLELSFSSCSSIMAKVLELAFGKELDKDGSEKN